MHIVIVNDKLEHRLQVHPLTSGRDIKEKLRLLLGIPVRRQILTLDDIVLADQHNMGYYGVQENESIILTINSEEERFTIYVTILRSETFELEVEEMDTVISLKYKIQEKINVPDEEELALFYKGTEMRDSQRLCEYRACLHSEIIASFKPRVLMPPPKSLRFVVKTGPALNSMSIPFQMPAGHTVSDLKKRLMDKNYLPQGDYHVFHKEKIMDYNESLLSQGVQDGDSIQVLTWPTSTEE